MTLPVKLPKHDVCLVSSGGSLTVHITEPSADLYANFGAAVGNDSEYANLGEAAQVKHSV